MSVLLESDTEVTLSQRPCQAQDSEHDSESLPDSDSMIQFKFPLRLAAAGAKLPHGESLSRSHGSRIGCTGPGPPQ